MWQREMPQMIYGQLILFPVEDFPELPRILQNYIDEQVKQKDIPAALKWDHNISIRSSLRSVQLIMKKCGIRTARRNGLTGIEQAFEVLKITEDDPLGRWGGRTIKSKLALKGVHIPRDAVLNIRRADNPDGVAARHPRTRKIHHHGLHSSGPNEEWCVDGHEKILNSMGIAVWGVVDKFSRLELGLWAVPNARLADVPPALYLRLVHKLGGMPLTTTSDKGSELSKLIPLVTTLRQKYQPFLSEETLPSHKAVKSVSNITRERGWRPIWEKELGNLLFEFKAGRGTSGFHYGNTIHE
ncbi:hypothetical protein NLJ89_g10675 [Agrocybe chaxingu]|uniref:Integrase catalytic domain-containing protein n=1 Tax=Agrocybe chaxingu TaxID=84603 RepID=A0A9W8MQP5_9AGAR|nr:hypothetical protein NLJ89_g10675 [Agrocybe chaxingu]